MQEDWALDYMRSTSRPSSRRSWPPPWPRSRSCRSNRSVRKPASSPSVWCCGPAPHRRCSAAPQADGRPRVRLLVDLLEDEADLTVIVDRKVIFLRTARCRRSALRSRSSVALVAEFRRTMGAVQNQLGGRKVESIVLCGLRPGP